MTKVFVEHPWLHWSVKYYRGSLLPTLIGFCRLRISAYLSSTGSGAWILRKYVFPSWELCKFTNYTFPHSHSPNHLFVLSFQLQSLKLEVSLKALSSMALLCVSAVVLVNHDHVNPPGPIGEVQGVGGGARLANYLNFRFYRKKSAPHTARVKAISVHRIVKICFEIQEQCKVSVAFL